MLIPNESNNILIYFLDVADQKRRICQTRECVRSAANLMLSMDQKANPCEDFYQVIKLLNTYL